jgi:CMP-N-acetylneuraminic acid synthetase
MNSNPSITAIIPARAGSRGLPRKNVLRLAGRPLIVWSIDAACHAESVNSVIVSTDSEEIADISREAGAGIPFLRPAELATDAAGTVDVVLHAIDELEQRGEVVDWVLLLQPTSPLRTSRDIEDAIALQRSAGAPAVVSVVPLAHPPHWSRRLTADGRLEPWLDAPTPARRQDAEPLVEVNGAIYLIAAATLRAERNFLPDGTRALVMPKERSIDIDTAWDFHLADLILRDRAQSHAVEEAGDGR